MGMAEERILIAEDGDVIAFKNQEVQLVEPVYAGRVLVDGKGVGDVGDVVLRDRRRLSGHGMVVVLLALDENTGDTIYGPDIISRGFLFEDQGELILEEAKLVVLEVLDKLERPSHIEAAGVREDIQRRLKRYFYKVIKRRPIILPIIISV
jgi:ribonuclease J